MTRVAASEGVTTLPARRSMMRILVAIVAWAVVVALVAGYAMTRPAPLAPIATFADVEPRPVERLTTYSDDPGMHGVIGQLRFHQDARTVGPSPDRLDFRWDRPVHILGVLVSVEDRGMALTEIAVGIDARTYGLAARDWLIHTSMNGGRSTDEHIWFPEPFAVHIDEAVNVTAYLFNDGTEPVWLSPEVIIYYEWID